MNDGERERECGLCGRGTTLLGNGPCCDACEREDDLRRAAADHADHMESWGCNEEPTEDDEDDWNDYGRFGMSRGLERKDA